jgi:hypothetical protein
MGKHVDLQLNTQQAIKQISDLSAKRMWLAANEVRNETVERLSGERSGRTYKVPGTQVTYTASAPGEPPAVATSDLRQSIKVAVDDKSGRLLGSIGSDLDKSLWLEKGTSQMLPRPFLEPSFRSAQARVKEIMGGKWF